MNYLARIIFIIHLPLNFFFRDKTQYLLKNELLIDLCNILSKSKYISRFFHLLVVLIFKIAMPFIVITLIFYFVLEVNIFSLEISFIQSSYLLTIYSIYINYIIIYSLFDFLHNYFNYEAYDFNSPKISVHETDTGENNILNYKDLKKILNLIFVNDVEKPDDLYFFSIQNKKIKKIKLDLILRLLNVPIILINQIGFFLLLIYTISQVPFLLLVYIIGVISEYRSSIKEFNKQIKKSFDENIININKVYFNKSIKKIKEDYYCIIIALLICIPHMFFKESTIIDTYRIFIDEISFNALSLFTIHSNPSIPLLLSLFFWVMIIISDFTYLNIIFNFFDELDNNFQMNFFMKPNDFYDILFIKNEINNQYNYNRSILFKKDKVLEEYNFRDISKIVYEIKNSTYLCNQVEEVLESKKPNFTHNSNISRQTLFFIIGPFHIMLFENNFYFMRIRINHFNNQFWVYKAVNPKKIVDYIDNARKINNLNSIFPTLKNEIFKKNNFQKNLLKNPSNEFYILNSTDIKIKNLVETQVNGFIDKYNAKECNNWLDYISKINS